MRSLWSSAYCLSSPAPDHAWRSSSRFHPSPPTRRLRYSRVYIAPRAYAGDPISEVRLEKDLADRVSTYSGVQLEDVAQVGSCRLRLDKWISSRLTGISRARVHSSIRAGLVRVNGRTVNKASYMVRPGDNVKCTVSDLQPLKAEPEDIPLDIVFEDDHVLVVNKPAYMVVHPAPGNATGTLVNGILHHCSLPTVAYSNRELLSESKDVSDDEFDDDSTDHESIASNPLESSVRPGIVHRLDKGTSGLLVVAKSELSHASLSEQFKLHTIHRVYISLTSGVPSATSGHVNVPIGRDLSNRIRMIATSEPRKCAHCRHAASRYEVTETLAGGASAIVEWRLETGRTHQIRAHAKYLGIPLLGDELYGGTKGMAMSLLRCKTPPNYHELHRTLISKLGRPCLHAKALGFRHPWTGERINLSCPPPEDFAGILSNLRRMSKRVGKV